MATKNKKPAKTLIGSVFSSDSSSDDYSASNRSANEQPITSLRVFNHSGHSGSERQAPPRQKTSLPSPTIDDEYNVIEKNKIGSIRPNAMIQYEKNDGKIIKNKYFKKYDSISNTIVLGFYKKHNKRNYTESLDNIKTFFLQKNKEDNQLQDALEIPKEQWKTIRRDMIISYEKIDHEMIYRSKFNAFLKGADGTSRMSFTSERGYNYTANPDKIIKIYRHISSNDRTLGVILDRINKLEMRVRQLEQQRK